MLSELQVVEERLRVELGDLPGAPAGAARALLHLVLAGVGVGRQVADVGDVHHVATRWPFQRSTRFSVSSNMNVR